MGFVLRFRLAGVPVEVEPSFWLATIALASHLVTRPHLLLAWVAVVFLSVLLHEMGHALMFRRLRHRPAITLNMMGGAAQTASAHGLTTTGDILVSLAGPCAGFLVGVPVAVLLAAAPALRAIPFLGDVLGYVVVTTIGWGLFNLLPVLPLDGGQIMHALLRKWGVDRATTRAHQVSVGVAGAGALLALAFGQVDLALMAGFLAGHGWMRLRG